MKSFSSFNFWFLIPFLLWVITGGILLANYDQWQLFGFANSNHTPFLDGMMYGLTLAGEGSSVVVFLLLLLLVPGLRNWWYLLTATVCCGLSAVVVQILKKIFSVNRPYFYHESQPWIRLHANWPELFHYSFPSGHSTAAFSVFCLFAFMLPRRFRPFGVLLFIVALAIAYSRMYVAAHFFLDIYVGSIIGVLFCSVFFYIMHRLEPVRFQEHWNRHKVRITRKP